MKELIENYFSYVNVYTPVLHRPTFEKDVKAELHLRDVDFAGVVLQVCAVGARYSDDERVFLPGPESILSHGHKWQRQVRHFNEMSCKIPSLYQLQALAVSSTRNEREPC